MFGVSRLGRLCPGLKLGVAMARSVEGVKPRNDAATITMAAMAAPIPCRCGRMIMVHHSLSGLVFLLQIVGVVDDELSEGMGRGRLSGGDQAVDEYVSPVKGLVAVPAQVVVKCDGAHVSVGKDFPPVGAL